MAGKAKRPEGEPAVSEAAKPAQVALALIEAGDYENVVSMWAVESRPRWKKSKFFKRWQTEQNAGHDPHKAFKDRGWEP
jgi:hypothetical protein